MRAAVFFATAISLWRDRAAFALAFILPAAIFAIFSLVFSSAAGGDMKIRLALLAGADGVSQRLAEDLGKTKEIGEIIKAETPEAVGALVRSGRADVGYVLEFPRDAPGPVFTLYADQTRGGAALVAESALARLAPRSDSALKATSKRVVVNPVNADAPMAAYFAAGVAMLFLFLSGFQSALTLLEERDAGVLERVAAGPAGLAAAIDGKFLFIALQGLLQIGVILAAAAILFRVDLTFAPDALFLAAVAGAVAAAGVSIAVTALCRSTRQAHAIGAVFSLVAAALGGSMAPRFLMPEAIQKIGGATPNALGIDAFGAALWTGGGLEAAAGPAGLLLL
ncbi:MAG: ABC transporter permease, partial [Parvularculaceae bacterium]|nr:ABC transporter permease [Parvularculaceae bacterium]